MFSSPRFLDLLHFPSPALRLSSTEVFVGNIGQSPKTRCKFGRSQKGYLQKWVSDNGPGSFFEKWYAGDLNSDKLVPLQGIEADGQEGVGVFGIKGKIHYNVCDLRVSVHKFNKNRLRPMRHLLECSSRLCPNPNLKLWLTYHRSSPISIDVFLFVFFQTVEKNANWARLFQAPFAKKRNLHRVQCGI